MLARYARRFLFIEFTGYGLAAAVLLEPGVGWPVVLAAVLGVALLMRCVAVAATFVLAAMLSPTRTSAPLLMAARLRLVGAEVVWTTLAYSVLMPFPGVFSRADSRLSATAGTVPVLLVHGYICNGGIWVRMRRFLKANGVATYTHDLEPVYAGIDDYTAALASRVEDICLATGAQCLIVVAHSMGGLAARACLRAKSSDRVAKLITLGTPHHGTRTARMGLGANARQMEPGSTWLESLARPESLGAPVPITSIYSTDDNVVVPQDSSVLDQARNIRLSGIGHVSLPFSRIVQEIVLEEIRNV
jgi:triacylglycerol esterase/lipase EstA (alpha/beta hydrolase family)